MSISDDIRTVLRTAAGPLTCSEIRETCDEDYTAEQIGGAINGMFITGEVIRDGEGRGKFTYMLDTAFVPKRARVETEAAEVPPPQTQTQIAGSVKASAESKSCRSAHRLAAAAQARAGNRGNIQQHRRVFSRRTAPHGVRAYLLDPRTVSRTAQRRD